jgi:vacuolar-type H+-ATPase subunit H
MPESPNLDAPEPGPQPRNWSRAEIDAAIAGLDRATRRFTGQVDAIARGAGTAPSTVTAEAAPDAPVASTPATERSSSPAPAGPPRAPRMRRFGGLDQEMNAAEQEAREYLAQAKKRADSLVATMIGAVEREAAELRREAEAGIRARWNAVEQEAGRYLEDARRVADGMVTERQSEISSLSDDIVANARTLTGGLEDADRIRAQFDAFVRTLSATAGRIAEESSGRGEPEIETLRDRADRADGGALAA